MAQTYSNGHSTPQMYLGTTFDNMLLLSTSGDSYGGGPTYEVVDVSGSQAKSVASYRDPKPGTLVMAPDARNRVAYSVAVMRQGGYPGHNCQGHGPHQTQQKMEFDDIPRSSFKPVHTCDGGGGGNIFGGLPW
jgi:hypothetical protein